MIAPTVLAIATGNPGVRYRQQDIFEQVMVPLQLANDRRARAVFMRTGVAYRHSVVDGDYYLQERRTGERNDRYVAEALPLGEDVVSRCLRSAGLAARDVDDFFVVSCTGIDTPGLDLQLAGRLGMRSDLRRTNVLGMGCYAAFPGLLRAREAAASRPGRTALVLALELCSLHLQMDDSLENLVSSALFSDGAAAVLVRGENGTPNGQRAPSGPRLLDAETYCDYQTFDHMAFHLTDHGFQMRLSAYVPDVLAASVEGFVDRLLARNGLAREDVAFWGVHPGSSKILDHVQNRLGLPPNALDYSRRVLRDFGNMSSPTILFVLDEIQRCGHPQPGDTGVLMAFGPGLTMESLLVRW